MKNILTHMIKVVSIFLAGICSSSGSFFVLADEKQVSELPIESWESILENGRPANSYKLTFNESDKCQPLLDALNRPILPDDYKALKITWADDYFLRNKYSYKWESLYEEETTGSSGRYLTHADLNNDGAKDWLVRQTHPSGPAPGFIDEIFWVDQNPRKFPSGSRIKGESRRYSGGWISNNVVVPYDLSDFGWNREMPSEHWTELVQVDDLSLYLSVKALKNRPRQRIEINVYKVAEKQKGTKVCEILSQFEILNLN